MAETLSIAKTDNFAIWGWKYSDLWYSDTERWENEFPARLGSVALDSPKPKTGRCKITFNYQKNLPIVEFAKEAAEQIMNHFDRPETELVETSHRWVTSYITRRDGEKVVILSEREILSAFAKFGLRGVYGLAVLVIAQLGIGHTGPLSKRRTNELVEAIELASLVFPFEIARDSLTKEIDRMVWGAAAR